MILDTTTRKIQIVLTAAKTTLDMPVIVDYVDSTATTFTPGTYPSNTNGVTLVDILPAPAASTQRKINSVSVYNRDTAAKNVQVFLNDNGTSYQILDLTLQIDDTLCYTDVQGWYTVDSQGNLKSVQSASANSMATAISGSPEKATPVAADKVGIVDSITGLLNWSSFTDLLSFFAAKLGNAANVFSVAPATAAAHAVPMGQLSASSGSSLVGFQQAGTGAVARTLQDKGRDVVSVEDFGAVGDGITDDSAAIQAAIDSLPAIGGNVVFNAKTYKMVTGITRPGGVHLIGKGIRATLIDFEPTTNAICFKLETGSAVSYQGSVRDIGFFSNDTTHTKVAVQTIDSSMEVIENIGTIYPHWLGAGSIGLNVQGREHGRVRNIYIEADIPLQIDPIPSPHVPNGVGIDNYNFHNLYLVGASASYPVVKLTTGLLLTQVSFTGTQSYVGGSDGFQWIDTTSTASSNGLVIENPRWEQGNSASDWLVNIQHNQALQGLVIRGGQGGGRKGFNLRKVQNVLFDSFWYTSALEALNADTSVGDVNMVNCSWQSGSTATNFTGHDLVYGSPLNPNTGALPPTAFYCLTSNGAQMSVGRTTTGTATLVNFVPNGVGTVTATFRQILIGNVCFFRILIVCAGGASLACTLGTGLIAGLAVASQDDTCQAVRNDTFVTLGVGGVSGIYVAPPSWPAVVNASYVISGKFEVA